ncbi:hypothetical protein VTN00DRAFT_96 [Thermoascus crustaceus]|uniref:uncharacterized protein n=1 Tax=Thermoascus crustaceus TaxID=5088 RepID=UPI0037429031
MLGFSSIKACPLLRQARFPSSSLSRHRFSSPSPASCFLLPDLFCLTGVASRLLKLCHRPCCPLGRVAAPVEHHHPPILAIRLQ